jgi:hypothetical protein
MSTGAFSEEGVRLGSYIDLLFNIIYIIRILSRWGLARAAGFQALPIRYGHQYRRPEISHSRVFDQQYLNADADMALPDPLTLPAVRQAFTPIYLIFTVVD